MCQANYRRCAGEKQIQLSFTENNPENTEIYIPRFSIPGLVLEAPDAVAVRAVKVADGEDLDRRYVQVIAVNGGRGRGPIVSDAALDIVSGIRVIALPGKAELELGCHAGIVPPSIAGNGRIY
jgi:hypothetical protein